MPETEDKPRLEPIILLIKYGADINIKNFKGKTSLDFANEKKHKTAENYLRNLGGKRGCEI